MKEIKQGFLWTIGAFIGGLTIALFMSIIFWISFKIGSIINPY